MDIVATIAVIAQIFGLFGVIHYYHVNGPRDQERLWSDMRLLFFGTLILLVASVIAGNCFPKKQKRPPLSEPESGRSTALPGIADNGRAIRLTALGPYGPA